MITILTAGLDDCQAIIDLQTLAYQSEARLYNDWAIPPLTQTAEDLAKDMINFSVLKAVSQNTIVGSVRLNTDGAILNIGRLIVHPDYQRRGIGSALLAAAEKLADTETRFQGIRKYELFTGSKSEGNIRLYLRHGYAIAKKQTLSPAVELVYLVKYRY